MRFIDCSDELWQCVESIAAEEGLGLYDLEIQAQAKLCVVVARLTKEFQESGQPAKPSSKAGEGVTSDDCSRLCRRLMVYFHAEGQRFDLGDEPQIDVSSPGVNRRLRLPKHFCDAVGERIKIVLQNPLPEGVKPGALVGKLLKANSEEIWFSGKELGNKELNVSYASVKKARVDFEFSF